MTHGILGVDMPPRAMARVAVETDCLRPFCELELVIKHSALQKLTGQHVMKQSDTKATLGMAVTKEAETGTWGQLPVGPLMCAGSSRLCMLSNSVAYSIEGAQ